MGGINGLNSNVGINGINGHVIEDDLGDMDEWGWDGGEHQERAALDSLLDSCLAIGS